MDLVNTYEAKKKTIIGAAVLYSSLFLIGAPIYHYQMNKIRNDHLVPNSADNPIAFMKYYDKLGEITLDYLLGENQ